MIHDNELERKIATKKIKDLENTPILNDKGEVVATIGERAGMLKESPTGITIPAKFNFNKIPDNHSLATRAVNMQKRASEKYYDKRLETMRDNFIYIIQQVFNSDANDYIEQIKKMGLVEFYDMYLMHIDDMDFNYYDSDGTLYEDNTKNKQLEKLESDLDSLPDLQILFHHLKFLHPVL
jgi:hypothetical protein